MGNMHSFVVTAYKDPQNLTRLVSRLGGYPVFIHVDASSVAIDDALMDRYNAMDNVYAEKRYVISWGSYKHLLALLELLRRAVDNTDGDGYVHLISGQDILIRSDEEFHQFFDGDRHIYMDCRTIDQMEPHQKSMYQWKNRLWRYNYWNKVVHGLRNIDIALQKAFHLVNDNFGGVKNIAQGLVWMSLPVEAARYVLDFVDSHPRFMKDLYQAQIPEEFLFQTVLVNSPFAVDIVPDNLRYMDWHKRNGSLPAYLDESDYPKAIESGCFFARIIDSGISKEFLRSAGYDVE
ncbi:beta-1,6-N-acetylglucosaminyltransferase [Bifidobacterium leontopitheci]|uniref:Peptide O-xylosyltransferase n=1 Tax=Bifidobacterium leontopitheci TaxID=2650774 RepID=A0A6I1GJL8_9BIFI|nr:beta-1,6-N-acetylglucosaminyltransferase [Bifidobacterium leontopitheci]KAB7789547.1 glycogen branching protein [Bifidobacterium leontopitheci]